MLSERNIQLVFQLHAISDAMALLQRPPLEGNATVAAVLSLLATEQRRLRLQLRREAEVITDGDDEA